MIGIITEYVVSNLIDKHRDKLPDRVKNLITADNSLKRLLEKDILPKSLEALKAEHPELNEDEEFTEQVIAPALAHIIYQSVFSGKLTSIEDLQPMFDSLIAFDASFLKQRRLNTIITDFAKHYKQALAPHQSAGDALIIQAMAKMRGELADRIDTLLARIDTLETPPSPTTTDTTSVFLSYARADDDPDYDDLEKSFMRRLYNALIEAGFAVWWDREALGARSVGFTKEIENAITTCERFVLVVGPGAVASEYVRAEWQHAISLCKPITPILREGEYDIIPAAVAGINSIDVRPSRDESAGFTDLINRLNQDAPLGDVIGTRRLPDGYITRHEPFEQARDAICSDAIQHTVISAGENNASGGVAVYGIGGIGKSTLATALAGDCQVRRHYPDGVLWVEVGQTPFVLNLQSAVGVMLGDDRENYQDETSATLNLSRELQGKQVLIVLDDVWDHKLVEKFPVNGTSCRLLITTRSRKLANLVHGEDVPLNTLTPAEGARLIAGKLNGDQNDPLYKRISERLGGHTLAVTLAAAQIADGYADDAEDMLRLIDKRKENPDPFRDLTVDDDDKDLNLSLSLSLSYEALPNDELRRRFRQTGIFVLESTFDRNMLASIWGDDEDDVRRPIATLEGLGLLDKTPDNRYSQHRLLHAYARALLSESGEFDDAFNRYADIVTQQAEQFIDLPPQDWGQLDPLLPHVDHVGEVLTLAFNTLEAHQKSPSPVVSEATESGDLGGEGIVTRMSDFAYNVVRYVERRPKAIPTEAGTRLRGMDWLEAGLSASRKTGNRRREGLFLNQIALAWSGLGEKRKAIDYFEQKLPIDRELGDRGGEATTLNNIGMAWSALGEKRKALEYYEKALPLRRSVGDRGGEATTLNNIGALYNQLGDSEKALAYYEQALPLYRGVGDRGGEASTLNNIGYAWDDLGEKRKALAYYEQALPLSRSVGDRGGEARTLNNIGALYNQLGDFEKALAYYEKALPLRRSVGDRGGEATTLAWIGTVYRDLGDFEKALAYYEQALPLRRSVGDRGGEAGTLSYMALASCENGYFEKALHHINEAIAVRPIPSTLDIYWRGHIQLQTGAFTEAIKDFQDYLNSANDGTQSYVALWISVAYRLQGDPNSALDWLKRSFEARQALDGDSLLRVQAIQTLYEDGVSVARPLYEQVLSAPDLKQKPFSPRFYVYQLATLFPERSDLKTFYDWFTSEVRKL